MTKISASKPPQSFLGNLPQWDLTDLYPDTECAELKDDLIQVERMAKDFSKAFRGKLKDLTGKKFGTAIAEYEDIEEVLGRVLSYAQLVYAGDVSDPEIGRFYQTMQEKINEITAHLLFFAIELNAIDDGVLNKKLRASEATKYRPWLKNLRAFKTHQLEEQLESLLHDKRVAGQGAWCRLFDETMADMRFEQGEKKLTSEEVMNMLSDPDEKARRSAAAILGKELSMHARTFSLITNTLAKDKEIEDRWRSLETPQSSRNLSNQVEDRVVDALSEAVTQSYRDISHRYYKLKAKWFGKEQLDHWDRNAPLPNADNKIIPWEQATEVVLAAYKDFSPELASVAANFFDKPWIDAAVRPGKSSGAFAHPTVPSVHPYLLLNYQGKTRDVMTLAHELGHGCHQVLAGPQGALLADTPLTLAETASVFGEMLTFRKLLNIENDPLQKKVMVAGKVEDMINTVVRQIAFFNFEQRVHLARRDAELTADEICDLWIEVQSESLGPAVRLDDNYRWYWTYIPHFIHSPFYVYAYAFGDCLVNSLYSVYEQSPNGFENKYLDLLRAGGSKRHAEMLAPFALDASDPAFWQKGLGIVKGLIDELDAME